MARHLSLERRKELALAAFEAIRARGLYGITMSELASLLGMKRSTVYWYFRDLGHVFEIVLEHVLERQQSFLVERMQALSKQGPPHPIDALYLYVEGIWAFFAAEGPYLLQLVSFWGHTVGSEPGRVIELTLRRFLPLRAMAVQEIERGIESGAVEPCDARAVVDLATSLVDGVLIHRVMRQMEAEPVGALLWGAVLGPLRRPRCTVAPTLGEAEEAGCHAP